MRKIPILFVTHNRLAYTVHSFSCLLSSWSGAPVEIHIWDNASTDGTRVWLEYLSVPEVKWVYLSKENVGLAPAMNYFLKENRDAPFVVKVDNDTVLPRNWLSRLCHRMLMVKRQKVGAISGYCLRPGGMTAKDWYASMQDFATDLKLNSYICGTGCLINMDLIRERGLLCEAEPCLLGGWTSYCRIAHEFFGWNFLFDMTVFIRLLNLKADHEPSRDFPEYDKALEKMRDDGNSWWESMGGLEKIKQFCEENGGFKPL